MVYDIDFQTGQVRWARELHRAPPQIAKHLKNSYASETPVTDGRRVYVYFGSIGLVAALNMSGETVWRQDVGTFNTTVDLQRLEIGNGFTASPWGYNGKVFLLSEDGDTYAIQAGAEFKILHKNPLNEMALATPAVARGSLFLRTHSKLYRITQGGQP